MLGEPEIRLFIQTVYPRLVVAMAFVTGSFPAAEDIVQEALVRAWVRSEKGETIESLPAWVTTVSVNLSRKAWRRGVTERLAREQLGRLHASTGPDLDDLLDVRMALARLPRRQRETAVLRYVLELDTREVAEILGIDEGTVKSHLSRARAALGRALAVEDAPTGEEVTDDVGT